ncbi:hypothetical protein J6TS2_44590 [Heyndrickxia sporothermodurans]|nr:hypothetical protein J6TS2_44590 [Heyndrickxia sporothermodurans]
MTIQEKFQILRKSFDKKNMEQVKALYLLKDEILALEEKEEVHLRILVDIYTILQFFEMALKLFQTIMDEKDRKDQKKLARLKQLVDLGYHQPLKVKEIKDVSHIPMPKFKYVADEALNELFQFETAICDCCEKEVAATAIAGIYAIEDVDAICPDCIVSGKAAQKFNGEFQDYLINDENVINREWTKEVLERTPGYVSWQGNNWLAHCQDYAQFIGYVGWEELVELGIENDFENFTDLPKENLQQYLVNDGHIQGYLFRCLQCQTYLLYADMS